MLTLTRRVGQAFLIDHDLELLLTAIRHREVDLLISGPAVDGETTITLLLGQPSAVAPGISVTLFEQERSKAAFSFDLPREVIVLRKEIAS